MGGPTKTAAVLVGVVLAIIGILLLVGLLDFLLIVVLRIVGLLFVLAGVLMLGWAFFGRRRSY